MSTAVGTSKLGDLQVRRIKRGMPLSWTRLSRRQPLECSGQYFDESERAVPERAVRPRRSRLR